MAWPVVCYPYHAYIKIFRVPQTYSALFWGVFGHGDIYEGAQKNDKITDGDDVGKDRVHIITFSGNNQETTSC